MVCSASRQLRVGATEKNSLYRRGEHEHRSDVRPSKLVCMSALQGGGKGRCAPATYATTCSRPPPEPPSTSSAGESPVAPASSTLAALASPGDSATPPVAGQQRTLARRWRCPYRRTGHGSRVAHTSAHVGRCTGRRRRTDTAACTHRHTRAQDVGRAAIIIASSCVSADGRSIKSRSEASLLAGRRDYRQIAGRTTHTGLRRRAVTEAEGGGGVETETQQQV